MILIEKQKKWRKKFKPIFLDDGKFFRKILTLFKSQLGELFHVLSLKPKLRLFVVSDFAMKTKKNKKHYTGKLTFSPFSMVVITIRGWIEKKANYIYCDFFVWSWLYTRCFKNTFFYEHWSFLSCIIWMKKILKIIKKTPKRKNCFCVLQKFCQNFYWLKNVFSF